mmetsp:Transcript_8939/g.15782  ORF Transcript_8939/g.15782 Transcript_8939/m.15782 type:complete len:214 (-) Transcript_8939:152-793(-)
MRRGRETRQWAVILAACFGLRLELGFVPLGALPRRSLAVALGLGSQWSKPAVAGAPEYITISDMPEPHQNANGYWRDYGQQQNQKSTYKSMDEELYLMVNNCGEFQISEKITGSCTGFAKMQGKGVWNVDGKMLEGKVKFKPAQAPGTGLKAGASVEVVKAFPSDDDEKELLKSGWKGTVIAIENTGDAQIDFEKSEVVHFVSKGNFIKLKLA